MSDESSDRARARVGDVLNDKWTLERLLGVGGMGAVYAGLHRNGARAAVKVLHRYLARHEDVRGRFLREGYAANRVDHPSVVKVLDDDVVVGGPDDGTAYLVMELLVGESLESRSARGIPITEREFLAVAEVVLEVLEAAHASGVVHRDIKPDNIFITREGVGADRIKVLDFGLARLREGQATTVHGIALGTPSFMSPEQAAGRSDEIDGRTDLFALAATGFRLLAGRRIHEGTNSVDLVVKMANLPAPAIRTVAPQVSEAVARVLDHALAFRREDRYENAASMRADVKLARASLEAEASPRTVRDETPLERSVELSASDLEAIGPPVLMPMALEKTVVSPRESALPQQPEESLAAIPLRRSPLVPALAALAVLSVGVGAAYAAGWLTPPDAARTSAVSPSGASTVPNDAGASAADASADARSAPDAFLAAAPEREASAPPPKALPARRPAKPTKPVKRTKH